MHPENGHKKPALPGEYPKKSGFLYLILTSQLKCNTKAHEKQGNTPRKGMEKPAQGGLKVRWNYMKYSSQENKIQFPDLIGKASDVQIIKAPDGTERILIDGVEIPNVSTYSMNIEFHKMPTFSANVIVRSFEIISPER